MADPSGMIPHLLGISLDGSGVAATKVVAINRTTGDRLAGSTNSDKVVIFDAANFTSGYTDGDIVDFENVGGSVGKATITISGGFQQAEITCAAASTVSTTL